MSSLKKDSSPLSTALSLDAEGKDILVARSKSLGILETQRHVFLCADPASTRCCPWETTRESWHYLKRRMKELSLGEPSLNRGTVLRTKAACLRICQQGPILVIYPDGVWYRQAFPVAIERIINEHLIGNKVVQEYAFLIKPLL